MTFGSESPQQAKPKEKLTRPKPCHLWSIAEVQKWLKRRCFDYFQIYSQVFITHEITGKALMHLNEDALKRIGITDSDHRNDMWREILKLRLKADIQEMKEMEMSSKYPADFVPHSMFSV